jgi:hypothetical protein
LTTVDHARKYIAEGWSVIPIPRGQKGPRIEGWQNTTFEEGDFGAADNIGVRLGEPSGGLTDIDLDAPEAVLAARDLLLVTDRVHGRPGKRSSHYWFISPGSKGEQFKDPAGNVLVEVRSTGQQTVLPPSTHTSGEVLAWETERVPNTVDPTALRESARLVAVAALLARHWPANGPLTNQHETAGLVAGLLCSLKLDAAAVEQVIKVAATIAGDENVADRAKYAADTVKKFEGGAKVRGGPELTKELGEEVIKKIRSWFSSATSKLDEMNQKHAVVFQQSGDLVVITEDADIDGRPFIRYSSLQTIQQLYPQPIRVGQKQNGDPIYKPLGKAWLESPHRRYYGGIELAPNGRATPGYYNLWRGFAVEPKPGSWKRFKDHIAEVICDNDKHIFEYVLAWMAQAVQKPGYPAHTAIALRGGQGTGKGAFVRGFGALFGVHFIHLDSTRHLTGNFNAHLHNAILVFADEAAWPGDKAGLGALKRLVTEPTLSIERKGHDIFEVQNMIHLLLASNEEWVVPAGFDERRFVVLDVPRGQQNNVKYFGAIEQELHAEGGLAAMLHDLLQHQSDINLRAIPATKALFEQKQLTDNPQRRWWYQVLYDGDLWNAESRTETGEYRVERDILYDSYIAAIDKSGTSRFQSKGFQTQLGMFLRKVLPDVYPKDRRIGATRYWVLPSLADCRKFHAEEYRVAAAEWPAELEDEKPRGVQHRLPDDM